MKTTSIAAVLLAALAAAPATSAAGTADHDGHQAVSAAANASSAALSAGEVRKVDTDTKKITIRHGPIDNLGMPPMTMVFQVSDPALLDRVKAGDKIRFRAEHVAGAYTVTRIEPH